MQCAISSIQECAVQINCSMVQLKSPENFSGLFCFRSCKDRRLPRGLVFSGSASVQGRKIDPVQRQGEDGGDLRYPVISRISVLKSFHLLGIPIGAWCNGSTPDFGSVDLGSNPGAPACINGWMNKLSTILRLSTIFLNEQSAIALAQCSLLF